MNELENAIVLFTERKKFQNLIQNYRFLAERTNFWTNLKNDIFLQNERFLKQTFEKKNRSFYWTITKLSLSEKTNEIDRKWTIILRSNQIKKNGTFKNNVRMKLKKPNLPSLAAINLVYNAKGENKFLYILY